MVTSMYHLGTLIQIFTGAINSPESCPTDTGITTRCVYTLLIQSTGVPRPGATGAVIFAESCGLVPLVAVFTVTAVRSKCVGTHLRGLTQPQVLALIGVQLTVPPHPPRLTHTANHIVTVQGMMGTVT